MRSRIVRVTLLAVSVALLLFAVPLALSVRSVWFAERRSELERTALQAAGRVGADFLTGDRVELPTSTAAATLVGVYDVSMKLRAGTGPASADPTTTAAIGGRPADAVTAGNVVVAVPIFAAENVVGVVRVSAPTREVWGQVGLSWLGLLGLVGFALAGATVVARRQARLLSRPLEALSEAALRVTAGDLGVRFGRSEIAEIDRVGRVQNEMVERLAARLQRERHFSADVSHQLRTPLTRLQLGLQTAIERVGGESATSRATLVEAVRQVEELHRTVEDILGLAHDGPDSGVAPPLVSAERLLLEIEKRWHGSVAAEGRHLLVRLSAESAELLLPAAVVAQVMDVLVENALRHGRGVVGVSVREMAGTAVIDVADEGSIIADPHAIFRRGVSAGTGSGIGLAFARTLAEAAGGRLVVASLERTRFSLLLPTPAAALDP